MRFNLNRTNKVGRVPIYTHGWSTTWDKFIAQENSGNLSEVWTHELSINTLIDNKVKSILQFSFLMT